MDTQNPEHLNRIFAALADQTRRAILLRLTTGEAGVMDLAEPFDISQPAISRHINVLESAGLITRHRSGTHRMCRLSPSGLREIEPWLDMIATRYRARYDRLDQVLQNMTKTGDD